MVDRVFIKSGRNGKNIGKKFKVVQRKRSVKNDSLSTQRSITQLLKIMR